MRADGIVSKHKKKFRVTTNSNHFHPIDEYLLQRQFDFSRPGESWVPAITYVRTMEESFESVCDSIPWKADRKLACGPCEKWFFYFSQGPQALLLDCFLKMSFIHLF
jgi:hypothetical protein